MGYSVTAGDFTGDGLQDAAFRVPKGLNYTGKVIHIFELNSKFVLLKIKIYCLYI